MAALVFTQTVIGCDGCDAVFGMPDGFASPTEARAVAYADGWRFPNQISATNGSTVRTTSDVCPFCAPAWQPQPRAARQRALTRSEMLELRSRAGEAP